MFRITPVKTAPKQFYYKIPKTLRPINKAARKWNFNCAKGKRLN